MRHPPQRFPGFYVGHPGLEWWHVVFSALLIAALVAALVLLIVSIHRHLTPIASTVSSRTPALSSAATDAALNELRMRYARGDVSREEFITTSADLEGTTPPPASTTPEPSGG